MITEGFAALAFQHSLTTKNNQTLTMIGARSAHGATSDATSNDAR